MTPRRRLLQQRDAADPDGLERRFYTFRFDEDKRILDGVAIRYGDTAKMPWGDSERFEAGAFGSLSRQDIILNVQHDRGRMLARTNGGGLEVRDSYKELRVIAELPATREADDTLELARKKILRGFSIEFLPRETRRENGVRIIEKAELRNIAVVDRPAYPQSKIQSVREAPMDQKQIEALIKEQLAKRGEGEVDTAALAASIRSSLDAEIEERVDSVVEKKVAEMREKMEAAQTEAEEERAKAAKKAKEEEEAEEKRKKKADEDEKMMKKRAEDRAHLLVTLTPLLDDDLDTRELSDKDLLVKAVGDEVKDAEERSEDYLLAKVEGILERRKEANQPPAPGGNPAPAPAAGGGVPNVIRMVERRSFAQAGSSAA